QRQAELRLRLGARAHLGRRGHEGDGGLRRRRRLCPRACENRHDGAPMNAVKDFTGSAFSTTTTVEEGALRIALKGNADIAAISGLETYLKALHREILRQKQAQVTVDIRELYFMNSSCLKSLVTWITAVGETTKNERYRITFVSNGKLHWQR